MIPFISQPIESSHNMGGSYGTDLLLSLLRFIHTKSKTQESMLLYEAGMPKGKKAAWKRHKMATDPDFKLDQKLSNKKWAQNNPGYWKEYRRKNPEKAERNRILQIIRNRRRPNSRNNNANADIPLIAKVDALKVNIFNIQALITDCKEGLVRCSLKNMLIES